MKVATYRKVRDQIYFIKEEVLSLIRRDFHEQPFQRDVFFNYQLLFDTFAEFKAWINSHFFIDHLAKRKAEDFLQVLRNLKRFFWKKKNIFLTQPVQEVPIVTPPQIAFPTNQYNAPGLLPLNHFNPPSIYNSGSQQTTSVYNSITGFTSYLFQQTRPTISRYSFQDGGG